MFSPSCLCARRGYIWSDTKVCVLQYFYWLGSASMQAVLCTRHNLTTIIKEQHEQWAFLIIWLLPHIHQNVYFTLLCLCIERLNWTGLSIHHLLEMFLSTIFCTCLLWLVATSYAQYAITGVQTGIQNGTKPFRRNIYDLQQNFPQILWGLSFKMPVFGADDNCSYLYIQGLLRMQAASSNDQLSWLQFAGGRSLDAWLSTKL